MYSEHGFDALIAPAAGQVCQSLMVVWNWMPGSAQGPGGVADLLPQLASLHGLGDLAVLRHVKFQSPSVSTARRNSSVTRTELLEFWPETVR